MQVLLTALSGLALLVLLLVLLVALTRVLAALEGIRASLSKIAMGVRAIEAETGPLVTGAPQTLEAMIGLADGAELIATRLESADGRLAQVREQVGASG